MRQGQQNRRGRGRNNNQQGRKGQNPLTRSFESTGPDVKIRGTPAHIAEKYIALARDAQSSGDPVLAENYLQHAEHYTRIILAFREQQMSQGGGDMANGGMRHRPGGFDQPGPSDDFSDDEGDDATADVAGPGALMRGHEPQPRQFEGQQPRFDDRPQRYDPNRQHHHRGEQRGFGERHDRPDRHQDRMDRYPRPHERHERPQQAEPAQEGGQQHRRPDPRGVPHHEQPEFLRRPVRRPRREENGDATDAPAPVSSAAVDDTGHD